MCKRAYLQCVVVRVLEESVRRVEHLRTEEVQPLPGHAAIVQAVLAAELDHEPLSQILLAHLDYLAVRVLEYLLPAHLQAAVSGLRLQPESAGEEKRRI